MIKKLFLSIVCVIGTLSSKPYIDLQVKNIIEDLYATVNGYRIPDAEKTFICETAGDSASVYGEILFESVQELLEDLKLTDQDVFYDLGSGTGKFVAQVYLSSSAKKVGGIELSSTRCKISQENSIKIQEFAKLAEKAEQEAQSIMLRGNKKSKKSTKNKPHARELVYLQGDMLKADISDATVVFTCSTCFSELLMQQLTDKLAQLKQGLRVLTLKQLPPHHKFTLLKTYTLPMTWSKSSSVYLYVLDSTSGILRQAQDETGGGNKV